MAHAITHESFWCFFFQPLLHSFLFVAGSVVRIDRFLLLSTPLERQVAGCLMPTRTIGDLDCKQALGDIVSPHPELKLAAIYAPPEDGETFFFTE